MSYIFFFILSFFICLSLVYILNPISKYAHGFGDFLLRRAFPVSDTNEEYKFSILRILFGIVLLIKAMNIHMYLSASELDGYIGIISSLHIILSLFLVFGFLTQYTILVLVFYFWQSGQLIIGNTLGNDIAALLGLLLLLTSAGKHISIDSYILKKMGKWGFLFFYPTGRRSSQEIAVIKFTILAAYWAICVYSLSMHLNEESWMTGFAGPLLLSSQFMSNFSSEFEYLFSNSQFLVFMSKVSLWLMMVWYGVILPFVLIGGVFRTYVIIWGVLFFCLSLFILQLGSLAEIEFLLWFALFWSSMGIKKGVKLSIFFDDKCKLCFRTIKTLQYLDVFEVLNFKPISSSSDELNQRGINIEDALIDLYAWDSEKNKAISGYELYYSLSQKLVLLWPLFPIMLVGKYSKIGVLMYKKIADNRVKWFGVCPINKTIDTSVQKPIAPTPSKLILSVNLHILFMVGVYLYFMPIPYLKIDKPYNEYARSAHLYGITRINVFNKTDLLMSENFYNLYDLTTDTLVPIFDAEGKRLEFHDSDRVYVSNSLRFARSSIGKDKCMYSNFEKSIKYLASVYLTVNEMFDIKHDFEFIQYRKRVPDIERVKNNIFEVNEIQEVCRVRFSL